MRAHNQASFFFIPKGDKAIAHPGVVCSELPEICARKFFEYILVVYALLNLLHVRVYLAEYFRV